ncbi:MAG TPA: ECF transporter S component, partial [Candidatus Limnocylindria bacterium]
RRRAHHAQREQPIHSVDQWEVFVMRLSVPRAIAIAGALVALASFFLPWVRYQNGEYSGADLARAIGPALAGVPAGGIKGFDIALFVVPALAIIAVGLNIVSLRSVDAEREARYRVLGAAFAIAGLGVSLLFLGSAVLGGAPGIQFQPGLVRTDNAVTTSVAKSLGAGAFVSVGAGVFLTILGFLASVVGAIFERTAQAVRAAWRTQDLVLLAVIAVVFGAVYWAWLAPYIWVEGVAGQAGSELFFAVWFTSGLLGGYILRRPGAAFLTETLTGAAEVLIGAPAGPILVITAMMEALGAELVFAATGYRRWGWATMLTAGVATALVALPWNWLRLGYFALSPGLLIGLIAVRIVAGLFAGGAAKVLGDLVAATGSLNAYAVGRERVREV